MWLIRVAHGIKIIIGTSSVAFVCLLMLEQEHVYLAIKVTDDDKISCVYAHIALCVLLASCFLLLYPFIAIGVRVRTQVGHYVIIMEAHFRVLAYDHRVYKQL